MKIAFCFLTRDNLLQSAVWERFFAGAPKALYSVYCHPKYPALVDDPILKNTVIENLVATRHAHISIVDATIRLFSAAFAADPDNDYFILLSESTIPLISFGALQDELQNYQSRSIMKFYVPAPGTEHYERSGALKSREIFAAAFYFHHQWIVLHRRHVCALTERPFLHLFDAMEAPDEYYFLNVLAHLMGIPLDQFVNRRTTFVNWQDTETRPLLDPATGESIGQTSHPKTYRTLPTADLEAARSEKCWFFRKVEALCDCRAVLGALDE